MDVASATRPMWDLTATCYAGRMFDRQTKQGPNGGAPNDGPAAYPYLDRLAIRLMADSDLLSRTRALTALQREVEADLIACLAEVDLRRLYQPACSSMFRFCIDRLGFSEDVAYARITIARASRDYPAILDALRSGRVHFTGLRLLSPHFTPENCDGLLALAAGKTKAEIEVLIASLHPWDEDEAEDDDTGSGDSTGDLFEGLGIGTHGEKRDAGDPKSAPGSASSGSDDAPKTTNASSGDAAGSGASTSNGATAGSGAWTSNGATAGSGGTESDGAARGGAEQEGAASGQATHASSDAPGGSKQSRRKRRRRRKPRARFKPIARDRFLLEVPVSTELKGKLEKLVDLLRHQIPDGNLEEILDRACTLLLDDTLKKRFAVGRKPRRKSTKTEKTAPGGTTGQDAGRPQAPAGGSTQGSTRRPVGGPTQAPTEAPVEAPPEAPTEASTQAPPEAPTQAPPEAPTQAPTDPSEVSSSTTLDGPPAAPTVGTAPVPQGRETPRDIPDAIRRAVYERDGGRCAYVDADGNRCKETGFLELHHLDGFAKVKQHDLDRIELWCRAHNQSDADAMYGRAFMDRFRKKR